MTKTMAGTPNNQPKMYLPILILQKFQIPLLSNARALTTAWAY